MDLTEAQCQEFRDRGWIVVGDVFEPHEVELLSKHLEAAHPTFGDRNNELTLIGLADACKAFADALRTALCNDDEVAAWKRGEVFEDPWPQSLRTIS